MAMPILNMPNVGEGVTEGTIVRWLKREGDSVVRDEPVVEIETDKAVVEVPAPFDGRLAKILVAEDETVDIGEPIAELEASGAAGEPAPPEQPVSQAPAQPVEPAPAREEAREEAPAPTIASAGSPSRESHDMATQRTSRYSPVVLKLAADHGIDLAQVPGTGGGGRVTRKDVQAYIERPAPPGAGEPTAAGTTPPTAPPPESAPLPEAGGLVRLTATRRSIAAHMTESHQTIPAAWTVVEADVTGLVQLRERRKEEFLRTEGVSLTYLPFFVQAIVTALTEHPLLNATYTEAGIEVHDRYDMGIAVAIDQGLLVPVVRDADEKSIAAMAREINDLGSRARERRLRRDEMQGATHTIDNTGAFGSLISQPIVPRGQVAIITTETIRRELRPRGDDVFAVRSVMNLCVSFDHRALDGAQVGRYMQSVKSNLEAFESHQEVS